MMQLAKNIIHGRKRGRVKEERIGGQENSLGCIWRSYLLSFGPIMKMELSMKVRHRPESSAWAEAGSIRSWVSMAHLSKVCR